MPDPQQPDRYTTNFDEMYDVIVAGFGFAGGAAAIETADQGGKVLIVEKSSIPGGISMCAGGGVRITNKPEETLAYLKATNNGTTPDDTLEALVNGMTEIEDYIRKLAETNNAEVLVRTDKPANYPFPGHASLGYIEIDNVPGFDLAKTYPRAQGLRRGPNLFKVVHDNVDARGIEVRYSTPAVRLITNEYNEVRGLWVRNTDGELKALGAERGVILACGGFEADPEMQSQHWQLRPVRPVSTTFNTGDGIRMAQDVGADLWHMWHLHGSYGFKHPDPNCKLGIRVKHLPGWVPTMEDTSVAMSWILVNRDGRRFMNEYHPYLQDTGARPLDAYDPESQSFPHIPAYLIADDESRKMYPLGGPVSNDANVEPFTWSADNSEEIKNGTLKQANTLEELARIVGCNPADLKQTLDNWNAACDAGDDQSFNRPANSMVPLKTSPYVVGEVWPVVSNTQGGPRHDAKQRILNSFNEPISRLFEAGELGSVFGFLYVGGGNLAECFVTGRIAAREAMALEPWA
ncbi:MAG: FAD-binding protein [Rhodospirillaceae bacterium]|jgi:succinate dehydrogenase/fumarate reductase flavoprotein subunit